jgi:inner membrane protein involved in colicin E2 resistance
MRPSGIASLVLIYSGAAIAWVILGGETRRRSDDSDRELEAKVNSLWGTPQTQLAPVLAVEEAIPAGKPGGKARVVRHDLQPDSSNIRVKLSLDLRRKGLLWYRTYVVDFDGEYTAAHDVPGQATLVATAMLPSGSSTYDDFLFSVNGQEAVPTGDLAGGVVQRLPLRAGHPAEIRLRYSSRGMDTWTYRLGEGTARVKDFKLAVNTDFGGFDLPTVSPTSKKQTASGWELTWEFNSLISSLHPAIEMPGKLNPGPLASRISYFAPVGLLFFLAVVVIIGMMRGRTLHPMHFLFICAAFFAFHLLLSYLADHIDINLAFAISAAASVLLVGSYVARLVGLRFTLFVVAPSQLLFLVLLSYAFFFKGFTGLTITIGSVLTLAILMHVTAKVDWHTRFSPPADAPQPPAPPPSPESSHSPPGSQPYGPASQGQA